MHLYTIGHSNHPPDRLIQLLQAHAIRQVVGVRSTPYSRFNPQFNQAKLQRSLAEQAIQHIYLGDTLGGHPKDPSCYIYRTIPKSSRNYPQEIDYSAVMQRPWFLQGIEQLLQLASNQITAILCSEEDPARCHRHISSPGILCAPILR